jgi:hypothetical protein
MRIRYVFVTLSAFVLALFTFTQPASAAGSNVSALWPSNYTQAQPPANCPFSVDINNFCWTPNGDGAGVYGPGVELGVKFTSSQNVIITGIRVYRVSAGTVTGQLWDVAGGQPLADGTFDNSVTHGWQDLTFSAPVAIQAGHTYVAAYHLSDLYYAFQNYFFTTSSYTVGPITELSSPDAGSGNGVYCYDSDPTGCAVFPTNTYEDTNYWVTPLWTNYNFSGFFQPVDNTPTLNVAKAGSAIPVKFSLGGNQGLNIFQAGYPRMIPIACNGSLPTDPIEQTVTAGGSSLQYDSTADQYTYVWKTPSTATGCVQFDLGLNDGSSHTFLVQYKK